MDNVLIKHLTEVDFSQATERAVVLVDFYADWCGPCKMLTPILEKLAGELPEGAIAKVNIDTEQGLASRFQITAVPTLILFKEGKEIQRFQGLRSEEEIRSALSSAS